MEASWSVRWEEKKRLGQSNKMNEWEENSENIEQILNFFFTSIYSIIALIWTCCCCSADARVIHCFFAVVVVVVVYGHNNIALEQQQLQQKWCKLLMQPHYGFIWNIACVCQINKFFSFLLLLLFNNLKKNS